MRLGGGIPECLPADMIIKHQDIVRLGGGGSIPGTSTVNSLNIKNSHQKTRSESDRVDLRVADCGPASGPMTRGPR